MGIPLPPLPPAPSSDAGYHPGGQSVTRLLAGEHDELAKLCGRLRAPDLPGSAAISPSRRRRHVAEVFTAMVVRHLCAEEQYLYPSLRTLPGGARLAEQEIAAGRAIRRLLRELAATAPSDPGFSNRCDDIHRELHRHTGTAADEVFPALRAHVSEADLIRLGNRVRIAEEAAPTRPHPAAPVTPPWNKLADPALGLLDKARDVLTARRTYVSDLSWHSHLW